MALDAYKMIPPTTEETPICSSIVPYDWVKIKEENTNGKEKSEYGK